VQGLGTAASFALQNKDLRYLTAMLDGGMPINLRKEYGASLLQRAAGACRSRLRENDLKRDFLAVKTTRQ
jgi:hypothetical protein